MKQNKKKIILVLVLVITIILYFIFGFKTVKYYDDYIPGKTYYVRQSRIIGISFCKVVRHCSAVDCNDSYSYEVHLKKYFEDKNMTQMK